MLSRLARLVAPLVAALAVPAALAAQFTNADYASRRDALLATIDSGAVVAFGAREPVTYWPPFFQRPSFQYLTGFDEPDAALLMVKRGGRTTTTLFVPPSNPFIERISGPRTGPAGLMARTGIAREPTAALGPAVDAALAAGLPLYTVSDLEAQEYAEVDTLTLARAFATRMRAAHPQLRVASLDSVLMTQRARKTAAEVDLLRRAAQISAAAHKEAMRAVAPGCDEHEIQALLEGVFRRMGGDRPGYGSIVGSGPNALKLHWMVNERPMRAGDVLVIDAATSYRHYSADVTRTLPVNGRFTPDQRVIYQMVLDAQAAFVRQIHDGSRYMASNDSGRAVIRQGLLRLGLIDSDTARFDGENCPPGGCPQTALYAWHGYGGHGIGLEVHDPAQYYSDRTFHAGDVFTVEPGIYIHPAQLERLSDTPRNRAFAARVRPLMERYANIGVRIEDDYALTSTGVEWLSSGAPRTIDEVEAMMRQPSPVLPGGGTCGTQPR